MREGGSKRAILLSPNGDGTVGWSRDYRRCNDHGKFVYEDLIAAVKEALADIRPPRSVVRLHKKKKVRATIPYNWVTFGTEVDGRRSGYLGYTKRDGRLQVTAEERLIGGPLLTFRRYDQNDDYEISLKDFSAAMRVLRKVLSQHEVSGDTPGD